MNQVVAIWYPCGGYGHFVNAVLSLHGRDFTRPNKTAYHFSAKGNSHDLELVAPKYWHDPETYDFDFVGDSRYPLLIDNGINNESETFRQRIPDCDVLKICYSDHTWPVIALTMIEKAMNRTIDQELPLGEGWNVSEAWSRREKYFLYLRDHHLRQAWKANDHSMNLWLDTLLRYETFCRFLDQHGLITEDFHTLWKKWYRSNYRYFSAVEQSTPIIYNVYHDIDQNLLHTQDLWDQAVINYFIWLEWGVEVPANDYANWFTSTKEIRIMLEQQGIEF